LITKQNLVVISHTVCMLVKGPKNLRDAGPASLKFLALPSWDGDVADP